MLCNAKRNFQQNMFHEAKLKKMSVYFKYVNYFLHDNAYFPKYYYTKDILNF